VRTILLLAAAAVLTGCTISTDLGPGGFQGGRVKDRSLTGSNLPPRDDKDYGAAKQLGIDDAKKLQQNTGSRDTSGKI
jgi:hypothetical protein